MLEHCWYDVAADDDVDEGDHNFGADDAADVYADNDPGLPSEGGKLTNYVVVQKAPTKRTHDKNTKDVNWTEIVSTLKMGGGGGWNWDRFANIPLKSEIAIFLEELRLTPPITRVLQIL